MLGTILGIIAILVAIVAAVYARTSADGAKRSADAAESAERRERTPLLSIMINDRVDAPVDRVIYRIRNEGPQDLDRLTVYRPRPPDGLKYPIAATGKTDWVEDDVDLGPLALTEEARFTLCCGVREDLPEFFVRIECAAGKDTWTLSRALPSPRPVRDPLGPAPDEARTAIEKARDAFDEIVARGGRDTRFFLDDDNRGIGRSLRDNAGRVGDSALKGSLERIADSWDQAFGHAPPGQYVYNLNAPADPARQRQLAEQTEVAHRGQGECASALDRLAQLGG